MPKNIKHIQHIKSSVVENGSPKLPAPSAITEGEIAVNYADGYETISIKSSSGNIVTFSSDNYYSSKKLGSAFTDENSAVTVTEVIEENEEITSAALNDLDERKLDASAYTPTDLSNYYTKDETSGATEISEALSAKADTTWVEEKLGSGFTGENSGVTVTQSLNERDEVIAYAMNELNGKIDNSTDNIMNIINDDGEAIASAFNYLNERKADASGVTDLAQAVNTISGDVDTLVDQNEVIAAALVDLDDRKMDASAYTPTDLSNYYNKTDIDNRLGSGITTANTVTKVIEENEVAIAAAIAELDDEKQDALVSGENIRTINNQSIVGSGDVLIEGGFKKVTNSTASTKVGLVNSLVETYNANIGNAAIIEGSGCTASGDSSHAEGYYTSATTNYAHAEGDHTTASGIAAHAEGEGTTASGEGSHAEGYQTKASGNYSHAEGFSTTASGHRSHAEGYNTTASTSYTHSEGYQTKASGNYGSHAEGRGTIASGQSSHAEGNGTKASGSASHAEGSGTTASGSYSHAEGQSTTASGQSSHAEGTATIASGDSSHAEGYYTTASSDSSHAEGFYTIASGIYSHAEGDDARASGGRSHAEGESTIASGEDSHAEGTGTIASGNYSHAEGGETSAITNYSHAEGYKTIASGASSHAEGSGTTAIGDSSHAEGYQTSATTSYTHSEGYGTKATNQYEHASGKHNKSVTASTSFGVSGNTLFSVGNGNTTAATHNALDIRQNGDVYIANTDETTHTNYYQKDMFRLQDLVTGFGGFKIKKMTQAEYNVLSTKDPNTIYIVV